MEDKLREQIANLEFEDYRNIRRGRYCDVIGLKPEGVTRILKLVKEAGYVELVTDQKFEETDTWAFTVREWMVVGMVQEAYKEAGFRRVAIE